MKISVITPSYNQGKFIQKCIDSVRGQSHRDIEHIILDNNSEDSTKDSLQQYEQNPLGVDVHILIESDSGQTNAINKGFRKATGDIVCWLNTDEYYAHDTLERVSEMFTRYPEVDVLYGDCVFVDPDGRAIKRKREFRFSYSMLLFYGCYMPSCATFIRRRVIEAGHLLDETYRVTMDFEYYVRLAGRGYRFMHVPADFAYFTWHETNISSTLSARRLTERRQVQDRYSGIRGTQAHRKMIYEILRYYWIAIRVVRRAIG